MKNTFADTHCHINIMTKHTFDVPMTEEDFVKAATILQEAKDVGVTTILNVGTSLIESINCVNLAQKFDNVSAAIGIHPNDLTDNWQEDLAKLATYLEQHKERKIVAIGECGMDKHYPDYNIIRQEDAFKKQIELALKHDLAISVHTRDAAQETLRCLRAYKDRKMRGVIHCFSEDLEFAQEAISLGFVLGIGGTITYPKNNTLRQVVQTVGLKNIILETDAPFLPPQSLRGKQNHPKNIVLIAQYIAELLTTTVENVSIETNNNVKRIFGI